MEIRRGDSVSPGSVNLGALTWFFSLKKRNSNDQRRRRIGALREGQAVAQGPRGVNHAVVAVSA